jgi:RNA polymerase sigma factor (sigma-70 family)
MIGLQNKDIELLYSMSKYVFKKGKFHSDLMCEDFQQICALDAIKFQDKLEVFPSIKSYIWSVVRFAAKKNYKSKYNMGSKQQKWNREKYEVRAEEYIPEFTFDSVSSMNDMRQIENKMQMEDMFRLWGESLNDREMDLLKDFYRTENNYTEMAEELKVSRQRIQQRMNNIQTKILKGDQS